MMAHLYEKSQGGQQPKTTPMGGGQPAVTTTAAPRWCWACGGDHPFIGVRRLGWLIEGDGVRGYGGGNGIRDSWRWNLSEDKDGNFKVKDLAFMVDDFYRRIPVRVELDKRGIELYSLLCPCCDDNVESCDHSLVTCNVAKSVWDKVFEWWKIGPVNVFSANDLFRFSGNVVVQSYSRALWQLGFEEIEESILQLVEMVHRSPQVTEFSDGIV
ncbi:RNA-directed DNA polymerase, eukaryota, reverse transcriptase zinc-binding domain protein [Tanacetum coccineum]